MGDSMKMARISVRSAVLAGSALLAASVAAQQQRLPQAVFLDEEEETVPRYQVELIVFENLEGALGSNELFAPDVPANVAADARGFGMPADIDPDAPREPVLVPVPPPLDEATDALVVDVPDEDEIARSIENETLEEIVTYEKRGFTVLDPADYTLDDVYARLVRLDAYRPMMRAAWVQPTVPEEETVPLKLRRIGDPPLRLNGTVSLYLNNYLHLVVDMALEEKQAVRPGASEQRARAFGDRRNDRFFGFNSATYAPPVFYRIQEDRIVRNGELRYYDHPKFGVLAKISRVEEAEPERMDTTGDLLPGN